MKMKSFILISMLTIGNVSAQGILEKLPSVSIGSGILVFGGDVGKNISVSSLTRMRAGYNISVEHRLGSRYGVALTGIFGKLAGSEYTQTNNLNFQSKATQFDLSFFIHTDKQFKNLSLTPYAGAGIGFLSFNPCGDLYDAHGKKYIYWSDGSIRDVAEEFKNRSTGVLVHDYNYETQLKDSKVNYMRSSLIVPITIGGNFRIDDNFDAKLGATYFYSFSDYIDNYRGNGNNDSYYYLHFSIAYHLNFNNDNDKPDDSRYDSIDFNKIEDDLHIVR